MKMTASEARFKLKLSLQSCIFDFDEMYSCIETTAYSNAQVIIDVLSELLNDFEIIGVLRAPFTDGQKELLKKLILKGIFNQELLDSLL